MPSISYTPFQQWLLDALTEEQSRAVQLPWNQNALVIAGAGTGKTRVLIARLAWLATQGVSLSKMLVTTFTNRAAREIEARLAYLLGVTPSHEQWPTTGTYHSIAARILRRHAADASEILGLDPPMTPDFTILDEEDAIAMVRSVAGPIEGEHRTLRLPKEDAIELLNHREAFLRVNPDPGVLATLMDNEGPTLMLKTGNRPPITVDRRASDVLRAYELRKLRTNAVDFSDLIARCVRLLEAEPTCAPRIDVVLADEYQDTDSCQERLLQALTANPGGAERSALFCVGDPSQLIYAWRGANIENILTLAQRTGATEMHLSQNWRSPQGILDVANAALTRNTMRRPTLLVSAARQPNLPVVGHEWPTAQDEAAYHCERIRDLIARGLPPRDIAVLGRTKSVLDLTDAALARVQIPCRLLAGRRFGARAEIRDVAAWIRLLLNPRDDAATERCLLRERRGIGEKTLEKAHTAATAERRTLIEMLPELAMRGVIRGTAATHTLDIVSIWNSLLHLLDQRLPPVQLVGEIIERTRIGPDARVGLQSHDPDKQEAAREYIERLDDLRLLANEHTDLTTLTEHLSLADNTTSSSTDDDTVTLSTIHQAKGLEWRDVAIIGLEEGKLPSTIGQHGTHGNDTDKLEEERRCLHVATTRARECLTLSWSLFRHGKPAAASPFIAELGTTIDLRRHELPYGDHTRTAPQTPFPPPAPGGSPSHPLY